VSGDRALALAASLRQKYPAELAAAALTQQALRASARAKFSLAGQMLFTRTGLEQASCELTARHAAVRFAGSRLVADLCCGIGGNLVALAEARDQLVVGIDPVSFWQMSRTSSCAASTACSSTQRAGTFRDGSRPASTGRRSAGACG
jgi:hypothetical protein